MPNFPQYHLHKQKPEQLQFEVYDLRSYLKKNGCKTSTPHSHSYHQIIWFFDGGAKHIVDFKTYDVNKNTILFISKDQIHAFDENQDLDGWLLHFNDSFFLHSDVDMFLKHNIFKSQENPCYAMQQMAIATAKTYMTLILEELKHRNRFGFEENIRFLLKSLLITLERAHQDDETAKLEINNNHELQYLKFKELIEQHYKQGISVKEYSEKLFISSKTLTTVTKEVSGKLPTQLIHERVLLEAKRLLRYTSIQISEVAFTIGFQDPSYFIKFFKRHENISPKAFRNSVSLDK